MSRRGLVAGAAVLAVCLAILVSAAWALGRRAQRGASLLAAVKAGDVPRAEALLREGANVEARVPDERSGLFGGGVYQRDAGFTPLALAVARDDLPMVRMLLAHGANVHAKTLPDGDEFPPRDIIMDNAAEMGDVDVLRLLLARGARVDARTGMSVTPLMLAARDNRVEAVRFLLQNGADVNAHDERGFTPLSFAKASHRTDHSRVIRLLQEASAPHHRSMP